MDEDQASAVAVGRYIDIFDPEIPLSAMSWLSAAHFAVKPWCIRNIFTSPISPLIVVNSPRCGMRRDSFVPLSVTEGVSKPQPRSEVGADYLPSLQIVNKRRKACLQRALFDDPKTLVGLVVSVHLSVRTEHSVYTHDHEQLLAGQVHICTSKPSVSMLASTNTVAT